MMRKKRSRPRERERLPLCQGSRCGYRIAFVAMHNIDLPRCCWVLFFALVHGLLVTGDQKEPGIFFSGDLKIMKNFGPFPCNQGENALPANKAGAWLLKMSELIVTSAIDVDVGS